MLEEVTVTETAEELNPQELTEEPTGEVVEEKEHEPPPDSPRFKEVYGKMKRAQRETEKLRKEIEAIKEQVKGVSDERTQEKQRETEEQVNKLWDDYADAATEIDGAKQAKILRQINELQRVPPKQPKDEEIEKIIKEREAENAVRSFKKKNTWFNEGSPDYSESMWKYAIATEKDLLKKGFDGSYAELLEEVERDTLETFPILKNRKPTPLPNVAGVNLTKNVTSNKTITLTEEQKRVAYGVFNGVSKAEAEKQYIAILKEQGGANV